MMGCASKPVNLATPTRVADVEACTECIQGNKIGFTTPTETSFEFFVRAMVNGQYREFQLDTGSYMSSVLSDARTESLPQIKKIKYSGFAMIPQECDQVKIAEFESAGFARKDVPVLRCRSGARNNILGFDLLNGQIWSIDFSGDEFSRLPSMPADKALSALPIKRGPDGHLELPIRFGNISGSAIFDTGCGITVIDSQVVAANLKLFKPFTVAVAGKIKNVDTEAIDGTGHPIKGSLYFLEGLQIGSLKLGSQLIVAFPFSEIVKNKMDSAIMIIGSNTMVAADWIFDLKNNLWTASPRKATP
jgi:hypothetical protein